MLVEWHINRVMLKQETLCGLCCRSKPAQSSCPHKHWPHRRAVYCPLRRKLLHNVPGMFAFCKHIIYKKSQVMRKYLILKAWGRDLLFIGQHSPTGPINVMLIQFRLRMFDYFCFSVCIQCCPDQLVLISATSPQLTLKCSISVCKTS